MDKNFALIFNESADIELYAHETIPQKATTLLLKNVLSEAKLLKKMLDTFGRLSSHFVLAPEDNRIELSLFSLLVHDLKKLYSFVAKSVELVSPSIIDMDPSIALAVYEVYVHINAFTFDLKKTLKRYKAKK